MTRRLLVATLSLVVLGTLAIGAEENPFAPRPDETIQEYRARVGFGAAPAVTTTAATGTTVATDTGSATATMKPVVESAAKALTEATEKAIRQKTTAGPGEAGFADRVNESVSDFLPLLQFAVNSISTSDDKKSVTAKFNPLPVGTAGAVSISATATDPEISSALLEQIVESSREAQKEALSREVGDYGDVTWSLSYGYQREARGEVWSGRRKFFGRAPELYSKIVETLVADLLEPAFKSTEAARTEAQRAFDALDEDLALQLGDPAVQAAPLDPGGCKLQKLPTDNKDLSFCLLGEAVEQGVLHLDLQGFHQATEALRRAEAKMWQQVGSQSIDRLVEPAAFDPSPVNLDAIHKMIDNQPQLVLSAALHDRDDRVGADSQSYSLKYELGTRNVNRVLKEHRWLLAEQPDLTPSQRRRRAFHNVMTKDNYPAQDRFTLSATYTERDDLAVEHTYEQTITDPETMTDTQVERTASLTAEGQSEWCAKLVWSRYRTAKDETDKNALGSLSVEYVDVDGGSPMAPDAAKRQSRVIARFTYALPVEGGTSIPVTLTWASKGEFLGEQNEVLTANVGLSWKTLSSRDQKTGKKK